MCVCACVLSVSLQFFWLRTVSSPLYLVCDFTLSSPWKTGRAELRRHHAFQTGMGGTKTRVCLLPVALTHMHFYMISSLLLLWASLPALEERGMAPSEGACWHPGEDWNGTQRFRLRICVLAVSLTSHDRACYDQRSVWPLHKLLTAWCPTAGPAVVFQAFSG